MIKRVVVGVLLALVFLYLGGLAFLYFNQRALFFDPEGEVRDLTQTTLDADLVNFLTEEGDTLTGWYGAAAPGMPTIVYYKGNTASFTAEYARYEAFQEAGYGFFAFDYRGFPASPGVLSQDNILVDALAAYDWISDQAEDLVIWGRSLGASPAVYVASQRAARAVLLESPFYSAVSVAQERYPFVPVEWFMQDPFRTNLWINAVDEPVMIVHGTEDATISLASAERLYAEVPNAAQFWRVEGGGHADLWDYGLWERAQAFFAAPSVDQ